MRDPTTALGRLFRDTASAQTPTASRRSLASLLVTVLLLTLLADLVTPAGLPLAGLYAAPIALATWAFGAPAGLVSAAVASAAALGVHRWGAAPYASEAYLSLAFLARAVLFGSLVGALVRAKRGYAQLIYRSERDDLTRLYNRRAFGERAERERRRARRYGRPLSIAFLDLDDFKRVNDELGHLAGDHVLKLVGSALEQCRIEDIPARFGGDEFVILMPETGAEAAGAAEGRLRRIVESTLLHNDRNVTFTTGLVTFDYIPETVDDMMRTADERLYEAKRARKRGICSLVVPRISVTNEMSSR